MKVKYESDMSFFDGLTRGKIYEVIRENDSQYIVNNDLGAISTINKDKFEIIDSNVKSITNYNVYFGTQERAIDSLSLLLEFPNHPRPEVREFQREVREIGTTRWLKAECKNKRWWSGIK